MTRARRLTAEATGTALLLAGDCSANGMLRKLHVAFDVWPSSAM